MTPDIAPLQQGADWWQIASYIVNVVVVWLIPYALKLRAEWQKEQRVAKTAVNAAAISHVAAEVAQRVAEAANRDEAAAAIGEFKNWHDRIARRTGERVDQIDAMIQDAKSEAKRIFGDDVIADPAALEAHDEELANAIIATADRRAAFLSGDRPVPQRSKSYAMLGRGISAK